MRTFQPLFWSLLIAPNLGAAQTLVLDTTSADSLHLHVEYSDNTHTATVTFHNQSAEWQYFDSAAFQIGPSKSIYSGEHGVYISNICVTKYFMSTTIPLAPGAHWKTELTFDSAPANARYLMVWIAAIHGRFAPDSLLGTGQPWKLNLWGYEELPETTVFDLSRSASTR